MTKKDWDNWFHFTLYGVTGVALVLLPIWGMIHIMGGPIR